jgi:hypothetical protein
MPYREQIRIAEGEEPMRVEHRLPYPSFGEVLLLYAALILAIGFAAYGIVQAVVGS